MPTIITDGAASAQGYGFAARTTAANYIEDVFSTYLYTGDGSTQAISNGIDLSTKGGMVWIKSRKQTDGSTSPIGEHGIWDTARGVGTSGSINKALSSNSTAAENLGFTDADYVSAFNSTGFSVQNSGGTTTHRIANHLFQVYASWTFRKQAKFFDVVTYTGNGANRTIAHNLGSVPGCIMVKRTDTITDWQVYHRSLANTQYAVLNSTAAAATGGTRWNSTTPTSTEFSLGTATNVNGNGGTYVAYLFAHDAGGFGASGADNVISCGSFTTDGSGNATVSLGYEPQFVLIKSTSFVDSWYLIDVMRGMSQKTTNTLLANTSGAESAYSSGYLAPTATGFTTPVAGLFTASQSFIYIAIRRGPMKTPTSGTSVFYPGTTTNDTNTMTTGFPVDMMIEGLQNATFGKLAFDRLRGSGYYLYTNATDAEAYSGNSAQFQNSTGINGGAVIGAGYNYIFWNFRRAPGFFDVVCYTGNGSTQNITHNLGASPQILIIKRRNSASSDGWYVKNAFYNDLFLNSTSAAGTIRQGYVYGVTSTAFTVDTIADVNANGSTYVAYLFATVAGVSKVGSYTGTGTTKQIDCGFTGGARFVLIKRTDSTGDWYVWDSARGIVAGNDPYLLLNSTAAEVTNTDYIDTYSAGFEISSTAPAAINANGGSFIFLAIA